MWGGNYYDRKKYDEADVIRWADRRITPFIICIVLGVCETPQAA